MYKTAWFVTESEVQELKHRFVFNNTPVKSGDIYQGLYFGVAHDDFDAFLKGAKKYKVVAVCEDVMQKIRKA